MQCTTIAQLAKNCFLRLSSCLVILASDLQQYQMYQMYSVPMPVCH